MNNIVKRITTGFLGCAIAGLTLIGCEKADGPAPFLCGHKYNQLLVVDPTGAPVGAAIPLDSIQGLIVTDLGIGVVVSPTDPPVGIPMEAIGKIVFAP